MDYDLFLVGFFFALDTVGVLCVGYHICLLPFLVYRLYNSPIASIMCKHLASKISRNIQISCVAPRMTYYINFSPHSEFLGSHFVTVELEIPPLLWIQKDPSVKLPPAFGGSYRRGRIGGNCVHGDRVPNAISGSGSLSTFSCAELEYSNNPVKGCSGCQDFECRFTWYDCEVTDRIDVWAVHLQNHFIYNFCTILPLLVLLRKISRDRLLDVGLPR
jgi:hypothetical protein